MVDQEISINISTSINTGGNVVFVSETVLAEELNEYIDNHIGELQKALDSMKKLRGPECGLSAKKH